MTIVATELKGQEPAGATASATERIWGMPLMKGVLLYAAVLTFAGFFIYFIVRITGSTEPPKLPPTMISASAALAGVLGSAFAVAIGVPTNPSLTNAHLAAKMAAEKTEDGLSLRTKLQRILSLEPGGTSEPSWPLTFGIWVYALVASAVAVTYFLNQNQTPPSVKALAIAFAGYVLALVTAAYGVTSRQGGDSV